MLATTDLEQIYQLRQLHSQIGAALAQIDQVTQKIFVTGLAKEQAELGHESPASEHDLGALRSEIVVYLQSIRRRSVKYLSAMKEIAQKFQRGNGEESRTPEPEPSPVQAAPEPEPEEAPEPEPVWQE